MNFTDLFINNVENETLEQTLPLFKEMAIDFETGEVVTKANTILDNFDSVYNEDVGNTLIENSFYKIESDLEVVFLEGKEALKVWVWKALLTDLNRYKAYSNNFGNKLKEEIGFVYDKNIKSQILFTEISDCLKVNPYILNVNNFKERQGEDITKVYISFEIETVYGRIEQEVINNAF